MRGSKVGGFLFVLGLGLLFIIVGITILANANTVSCGGDTMSEGDSCVNYSNGSTNTYTQQQEGNQNGAWFVLGFGVLIALGSFFMLREDKSRAVHHPPLRQNNGVRKTDSPLNARIASLSSDYKAFGALLEKTAATNPFAGTLLIGGSGLKVNQVVYLQLKTAWLEKEQKNIITAPVKAYLVSGKTLTAAIFKMVNANTYIVWDAQHQPGEVVILAGKAIVINLDIAPMTAPPARNFQSPIAPAPQRPTTDAISPSSPVVSSPTPASQPQAAFQQNPALEILGQRFARGEIDAATYLQMRATLEKTGQPTGRNFSEK